jgi:NTE family protein
MGHRARAAEGHADFPGRSLERARRVPGHIGGGNNAAEGDSVLEPHARRDRFLQIREADPPGPGLTPRAALPEELRSSEHAKLLESVAERHVYNIVQLIYRAKHYEGYSKDYEFSRRTMEDHWRAGYDDAVRTLRHPEVLQRPSSTEGVFTFDLGVDGRE